MANWMRSLLNKFTLGDRKRRLASDFIPDPLQAAIGIFTSIGSQEQKEVKMKSIVKKMFVLLVLAFLPSTIFAVQYDTVVTGRNDSSADILAVQKAVDRGGSVLLKGTFDFGKDGAVKITKDVSIYGERDSQGAPATKIKGGTNVFQTSLPVQLPPQSPGPKVSVQNINFDGAARAAICLYYCGGAAIINNEIKNLKPVPAVVFGQKGMFGHQAIFLNGLAAAPKGPPKYQPGAITGTIKIADNDIDMRNDDPEKTMAQGVFVLGSTGANIQILRNRVTNCSRNSIEVLDNYQGPDGSGMILVQGNKIKTAEKGIPLPNPPTPNGICVGFFMNMSGNTDPTKYTKTIVTENVIETKGNNSFGIIALVDRAIITSNTIKLNDGPKAMGISSVASDAVISTNKFEGAGVCAFNLAGFADLASCRSVIIGNNLDQFKSSKADVLLSGSCNLIAQKDCTVVDEGRTNLVMK